MEAADSEPSDFLDAYSKILDIEIYYYYYATYSNHSPDAIRMLERRYLLVVVDCVTSLHVVYNILLLFLSEIWSWAYQ